MNKKFGAFLPVIFTILIICLFHFTHWVVVKYYPVVVNFLIFLMFFTSLFQKETVIQKIARAMEPDIKPKALEYTRKLTYVWAVFTFLNWLVSVATVFMSEAVWALYNGFISYLLIGMFFAVEYIVRIRFKRKYDC
ncbi:hypothetical protein KID03_06715 [bacterium]|nr:hypothetical protein [bacterium]